MFYYLEGFDENYKYSLNRIFRLNNYFYEIQGEMRN
jgi:hypothetical protein